jgi:exodeoxyribonuclease VII large subunit
MPPLLSVQQFLTLVNDTLGMIPSGAFVIEGEVAEYKVAQGKWINFSLKDESADVRMPCFATTFKGLPTLTDGMRVRVTGFATVFARFGKFSLNVETAEPVGEGALQKAYLALKAKLEKEGVFDVERKRTLPVFPQRIGIITSREAAAFGDFLRVLRDRMGGVTIVHADVHVQGQYAVDEIVGAFSAFNALPPRDRPEALVLTRGGGSFEELHAFNDERVVRAVFSSKIPVMVGVGHERDETLCDFVADVRASTPSNAAERIVPRREDLFQDIDHMLSRIDTRLSRMFLHYASQIERSIMVFDHAFSGLREKLEQLSVRVHTSFLMLLERIQAALQSHVRFLEGVNPAAVLARGFAIVRGKQGELLRSAQKVAVGDVLFVQFAEGTAAAEVIEDSYHTGQKRLL